MKIAICYKGAFNINYIRYKGIDNELLNSIKNTIDNHKNMIYTDLLSKKIEVDTFLSSYNLDTRINDLLINGYNPKNFAFLDINMANTSTWIAQLNHLKGLVSMIKKEESEMNSNYDYFIFTRFDIEFHKRYESFNLDLDKFNITVEHPSGNCDDNLWIFPRSYLEIFEKSVDLLLSEHKITHELNHKIILLGGNIHYIDNLVESYMGHTIFSFIR